MCVLENTFETPPYLEVEQQAEVGAARWAPAAAAGLCVGAEGGACVQGAAAAAAAAP